MQITDAYRTVSRFVHNVTNAADDLGFVAGDITVKGDVVAITLTDKLEKYEPLIVEFKGEGGAREVNGALACELMAKGVRWVAATPEPEARWCILHGCKYGDIQCPVLNGSAEQEGPCEYCCEDAEQWGTTPAEILKKGKERLNSSEGRILYAVNSGTLKDINKRLELWDARIGLVNGGWEVLVENPSGCWMRGTENDMIMFFNADYATPRIIRKS